MGGLVEVDGKKTISWNSSGRGILQQVLVRLMQDVCRTYEKTCNERLGPWAPSGSTQNLMDGDIPYDEFCQFKPEMGDLDVMVRSSIKRQLISALIPGTQLGAYTIVGGKSHGRERSLVLRSKYHGCHHQLDLVFVDDPFSKDEAFLHSSPWSDWKLGIKGVHHKLLLNACGGEDWKFSITHGIRSRHEPDDPGCKNATIVNYLLFGINTPSDNVLSFQGVVDSIVRFYVSKEQRDTIVTKFLDSCKKIKGVDHSPAIEYLLEKTR